MTCDRYWREGILLVERDMQDPHREGCDDCARAHASREELVEILPLIGEGYTGDPRWQANVWQRIEGGCAPAGLRWLWPVSSALAVACVLLLLLSLGVFGGIRDNDGGSSVVASLPPIAIIPHGGTTRSAVAGAHDPQRFTASVDDHVRITVKPAAEVWIYRAERLLYRCAPRANSAPCASDAQAMVVDAPLAVVGQYEVLIIDTPVGPPHGNLDEDRAALMRAGVEPRGGLISVH